MGWNCDTQRLYLKDPSTCFCRPNRNTFAEVIAVAALFLTRNPDVKRIAFINPGYSFGRDAAEIVKAVLIFFVAVGLTPVFSMLHSPNVAQALRRAAVVADRGVARAMGISTDQMFMPAFTEGVFPAAFGGAMATPATGVLPGLGAEATVPAFAVAAIGVSGQVEGAVIVALARVPTICFAPSLDAVAPCLVMLAVLPVRPTGCSAPPRHGGSDALAVADPGVWHCCRSRFP